MMWRSKSPGEHAAGSMEWGMSINVQSISPIWLQNKAGSLPGICASFSPETHDGMDCFSLRGKSVLKSERLL